MTTRPPELPCQAHDLPTRIATFRLMQNRRLAYPGAKFHPRFQQSRPRNRSHRPAPHRQPRLQGGATNRGGVNPGY